MIPLVLKLKKTNHKELAKLQDLVVTEMYKVFDNAVIHGGTAIWRCYKGNRFSEDVDVYVQRDKKKIDSFFEMLEKKGFFIKKKKITENSIYSDLTMGRTVVRFEALFKHAKGTLKEYENSDGTFISVYTLSPEELVNEKTKAYLNRLKVRDLYDVFFLLRHVKDKKKVEKNLKLLTGNFKKPVDADELKVLVFEGIVPSIEKMREYIRSWVM